MNGPQSERIRKEIIKLFKDKFNLRITIQTNLKIVNFLDITFNLTSQIYQPYSKPVHINVASNHPPNIIRCLSDMIFDRIINNISSNKTIFDKAVPYYNDALAASGYIEPLTYGKKPPKNTKSRSAKNHMV